MALPPIALGASPYEIQERNHPPAPGGGIIRRFLHFLDPSLIHTNHGNQVPLPGFQWKEIGMDFEAEINDSSSQVKIYSFSCLKLSTKSL